MLHLPNDRGGQGLGRELVVHGSIYALANVISRGVGFIMIPFYTRHLTPAQYGVLELIEMSLAILGLLAGQRVAGAIQRFYFDSSDEAERNRIVSSGTLSCLGAVSLLALVLQPLCPFLARAIFGHEEYGIYLQLALVPFAFNFMIVMTHFYIRTLKKSMLYLMVSVANLVLGVALNLLFIVHLDLGIFGVMYSGIITSGATFLPLMYFVFRNVGFSWDWPVVKRLYVYTFPLVLGSLWTLAEDFLSRYFIRTLTDLGQVGIFSLALKFGVIGNLLITSPFFAIWHVKCWELAKQPEGPERMARVFTLFNFIALFAGLAISIPARPVIELMADPTFLTSADFVPLLVLTNLLVAHFQFFAFGMLWSKDTRSLGTISWIAGAAGLVLDYVLIRTFGLWGAASALVAAAVLRNILTFRLGQRLYRIPYEYRSLAGVFALAIAVFVTSRVVDFGSLSFNLCFDAVMVVAFPISAYLAGFFRPDEIAAVKDLLRAHTHIALRSAGAPDPCG